MDYNTFLKSKIVKAELNGFKISRSDINPMLFDFQKDIVEWALMGGQRAIFASFGLGKTFIQLEMARLTLKYNGGKALLIMPLGVKQEFTEDAKKLGIELQYVRHDEDVSNSKTDIMVTNYERVRDGKLDVSQFIFASLDEASVLRSYGSKTYQEFLPLFSNVKYKFVATATPSPNKFKELIHYAGFLGVMDTGQALTRFFKRDSTQANNLTLYPHKETEFWLWMSTWALFITKPSDLGYSDEGYDLPEMKIHYHEIKVNHFQELEIDRDGQAKLFRNSATSLSTAAREKRLSINNRIDKLQEIVKQKPDNHFIFWHDLEAERHAIKKAIPDTCMVYGSLDLETREKRIIDFSYGSEKYLATKPIISGSGCNFQRHCSDAIFLGVGFKFNDFIQAIHRIYRFLQTKEVNIHLIYTETETDILKVLQKKWTNHNKLVKNMTDIIKEFGLAKNAIENTLKRSLGIERREEKATFWNVVNNDSVNEYQDMKENSLDMILTSIPFSNHYEYSPSFNDFGHNTDNITFFNQMDYLTPELLRTLKPGRVAAIHVKDRILFGNATGTGMPTVDPFSDMTVFHFIKHGFQYFGRITIETDVVRENNQTYRLGWTELTKDATKMGVGCPEYVLLFRKLPTDTTKAYADIPVQKTKKDYARGKWQIDARAKWNSSGNRFLSSEEIRTLGIDFINKYFAEFYNDKVYSYEDHVKVAVELEDIGKLPATFETLKIPARYDYVWSDINRMITLNSEQTRKNLQNHICPLQFDIVDRLIFKFSNKGDVISDPFGGIMTVPFRAILLDRFGHGCELNSEYFNDGIKYLKSATLKKQMPSLFDIIESEKELAG